MDVRSLARDLGVAARLGWRVLRRGGPAALPVDVPAWRAELRHWVASLPAAAVTAHRFVRVPATRPPWLDTGLHLRAGETVTWFATGRVYLSRPLDLWVDPSFQLWARVGTHGPVFRGTRATHTFTATTGGPLQLASYFPGEWATREGQLGHGANDYGKVSGGMRVLLIRWAHDVDVPATLATARPLPAPVEAELARLREPIATPDGWDYLWYLGPGEIYRLVAAPDGAPRICCDTHGDVGILRKAVTAPLQPGLALDWRWNVRSLPADLREDSLPSHDYLSIAVEFDDGQDLTYYWSAALPVGTVYRCPLPTWKDRETHLVVRSGTDGLGEWHHERRDLHDDYRRYVGGPARAVVRVWLIANSLFLRARGQCEYSDIGISSPVMGRVAVL
jgi:hypothetical protein